MDSRKMDDTIDRYISDYDNGTIDRTTLKDYLKVMVLSITSEETLGCNVIPLMDTEKLPDAITFAAFIMADDTHRKRSDDENAVWQIVKYKDEDPPAQCSSFHVMRQVNVPLLPWKDFLPAIMTASLQWLTLHVMLKRKDLAIVERYNAVVAILVDLTRMVAAGPSDAGHFTDLMIDIVEVVGTPSSRFVAAALETLILALKDHPSLPYTVRFYKETYDSQADREPVTISMIDGARGSAPKDMTWDVMYQ